MDNIEREVTAIVAQITKTPEDKLALDTDLRVELNTDSLQGLQIVAAIEKKFGVSVPDEELDIYVSIRMISETIKKLQAASIRV